MCVLPGSLCGLYLQPHPCCFLVDCYREVLWMKIRIRRMDLVQRLPSVGSSTLKCLETLCFSPPPMMSFCRVQGATAGTQHTFEIGKIQRALWSGPRKEHCRRSILALPHPSGWSGCSPSTVSPGLCAADVAHVLPEAWELEFWGMLGSVKVLEWPPRCHSYS